jgi:hypothetical protein
VYNQSILLYPQNHTAGDFPMTEERKYAILFAATLLCARKLIELGDRPSPAKFALVENAISNAKFIWDRIDKKWPQQ